MKDSEFDIESWYSKNYSAVNATAIPGSISSRILHELIEKNFSTNLNLKILEVGSNSGEHLPYVKLDYEEYILTDIREVKNLNLQAYPKARFQRADITKLPFSDRTFDRVISTCVFHHLDDPVAAFRELRRVAKIGGKISILLPNDPGLMYRFLRSLTTLRTAKKKGILFEAQLVHAIEHRNHFLGLRTLASWVYSNDKVQVQSFPFPFDRYNLNAITALTVTREE